MSSILNASASGGLVSTGDTSANLELQSDGTTKFTVSPTGAYGALRLETAQTMTAAGLPSSLPSAGLYADFTGIPSWAKRITVLFSGVSNNGTSIIQCQIGDAGGIENTGYLGSANASSIMATASSGCVTSGNQLVARVYNGSFTITKVSNLTYVFSGSLGASNEGLTTSFGCSKTLSDVLTQIRITTVNGTTAFTAGTVNLLIEG